MGKVEKKFAKKKEREREVKKKLLARRQHNNAQAKEKKKWDEEDRQNRQRQRPIFNSELEAAERLKQHEVRMALEHNLKILEALEQEYLATLSEEELAALPDPKAYFRGKFQEAAPNNSGRCYPFEPENNTKE